MSSWILAARPKTLPAAVVPVWVGAAVSYQLSGKIDTWLLLCTLMGAICIQIATNFFNDAIDARKGADTKDRLGPMRATASGRLSSRVVMAAGCTMLLAALFFGWFIFQAAGWPMLVIGLVSCFFAYGYTGGPMPLAYLGLGELFVILFFGFVAVMGTVYVQIGESSKHAALAGAQVGLLSAVLISINNLRDREEDRVSNKKTLAVRLGLTCGRQIILWEIVLAGMLAHGWSLLGWQQWIFTGLPSCSLGMWIGWKILTTHPGRSYNRLLGLAALNLIGYATVVTLLTFVLRTKGI